VTARNEARARPRDEHTGGPLGSRPLRRSCGCPTAHRRTRRAVSLFEHVRAHPRGLESDTTISAPWPRDERIARERMLVPVRGRAELAQAARDRSQTVIVLSNNSVRVSEEDPGRSHPLPHVCIMIAYNSRCNKCWENRFEKSIKG